MVERHQNVEGLTARLSGVRPPRSMPISERAWTPIVVARRRSSCRRRLERCDDPGQHVARPRGELGPADAQRRPARCRGVGPGLVDGRSPAGHLDRDPRRREDDRRAARPDRPAGRQPDVPASRSSRNRRLQCSAVDRLAAATSARRARSDGCRRNASRRIRERQPVLQRAVQQRHPGPVELDRRLQHGERARGEPEPAVLGQIHGREHTPTQHHPRPGRGRASAAPSRVSVGRRLGRPTEPPGRRRPGQRRALAGPQQRGPHPHLFVHRAPGGQVDLRVYRPPPAPTQLIVDGARGQPGHHGLLPGDQPVLPAQDGVDGHATWTGSVRPRFPGRPIPMRSRTPRPRDERSGR